MQGGCADLCPTQVFCVIGSGNRSVPRPSLTCFAHLPAVPGHGFVELPRIGLDADFGQPTHEAQQKQENFPP